MKLLQKTQILIGLSFLLSCDLYKQDVFVEQYVVDSYLISGETLSELRLSKSGIISETFDLDKNGVNGAIVTIREHDLQGNLTWTEVYNSLGNGLYAPNDPDLIAKPRHRYDLEILTPDGNTIRANTVVPDTFSVLSLNATELPYQGLEQFTLELTPSFNPKRQSYYIFSTRTLDPDNAELVPLYANFAGDDGREDFFVVSSGLLNESNTQRTGAGVVELVFPWIGVAFYGPNRVSAAAVDDAMYNFVRSADVQFGGGTQSPGEIENVISNIDGGIGIFGSYAIISVDVMVTKPQF